MTLYGPNVLSAFQAVHVMRTDWKGNAKEKDQLLIYNGPYNMYANEGNSMKTESGAFTAPVRGVYYFAFSSAKDNMDASWSYDCSVQIVKNGTEVVAVAYVDTSTGNTDSRPQLFAQITLLLEAGDTITTKLLKGCQLLQYDNIHIKDLPRFNGENEAAFMGFLIVRVPQVK